MRERIYITISLLAVICSTPCLSININNICEMSIELEKNSFICKEPIRAKIKYINKSTSDLQIPFGSDTYPTRSIQIYDEKGRQLMLFGEPKQFPPSGALQILKPGETYQEYWIINAMFPFSSPGKYTIAITQFIANLKERKIDNHIECSTIVYIEPFDQRKLIFLCNQYFFSGTRPKNNDINIPISGYLKSIYCINDDIVLPYLDWLIRERGDYDACRALHRLKTKRSVDLITDLLKRSDRVGELIRVCKNNSVDIGWQDIVCY